MRRLVFPALLFAGLLAVGCFSSAPTKPAKPAATVEEPATPADLVEGLKASKLTDQQKALDAIVKLEPAQQAEAITALKELLSDDWVNPNAIYGRPGSAREWGVAALLKLGPAGEPAIQEGLPELATGLKNANPEVRRHSARAIALLGPKAKPLAGDLVTALKDKDGETRNNSFLALRNLGPAASTEVITLLGDTDSGIRQEAAVALDGLRPLPPDAVKPLVDVLKKTTPRMAELNDKEEFESNEELEYTEKRFLRRQVCEALETVPAEQLKSSLPVFVEALSAEPFVDVEVVPDPTKRRQLESGVHQVLRHIGEPALPALTEALKSKEPALRWHAVRVLGSMGTKAKSTEAELRAVIQDRLLQIGMEAAYAVVRVGGEPREAMAFLVQQLELKESPQARHLALTMLGRAGRLSRPYLPAIIARLKDENPAVRRAAVGVLLAFGVSAKDAADELAVLVKEPVANLSESGEATLSKFPSLADEIRFESVRVLGGLGPAAKVAVPALVSAMKSEQHSLRQAAAGALRRLGPDAKDAVPVFLKGLESDDDREKLQSVEALGSIGPAAKEAVLPLTKLLTTPKVTESLRQASAKALGEIGVPDGAQPLAKALTSDSAMVVRVEAAKSLALLGPAAKSASADLEKASGPKTLFDLKLWVAMAKARVSGDFGPFLEDLAKSLHEPKTTERERTLAVEVLAAFGPANETALKELVALTEDKRTKSSQKELVARGLGRATDAQMKPAVEALIALTKDNETGVQRAAVESLGSLGPKAKAAATRLRDMSERSSPVSPAAAIALEKVEGS